tara:strand:- start:193 stop:1353 length:1161 start_codon:yes stop_codon:yes gene_type:complete
MALVDLKTNLAEGIGGTNTDDGTFKTKQGDNTERTSELTKLPRPEIEGNENPIAPLPEDLAEGIIRGGIGGQLESLGQVGEATSDFLTSPKGALFVAKQQVLQNQNPSEHTRDYKPSSLIETQFEKVPRHTSTGFQGQNPFGTDTPTYEKDVVEQDKDNKKPLRKIRNQDINQTITLRKNEKGNSITTPSKRIKISKINENPVSYGLSGNRNTEEGELPKDFIKFYIKDVVGGRIIQFPAYLNDITDNSSGEFSPTRYIGRADQVYVYSGYSRSISFGFKVAALNRADINSMWNKIDDLKKLVLPKYSTDVIQNDNEERPVAPFVELTIGDLYNNQPGFFSSVNVTIPQTSTWEIDDLELSHICDVSVEFTFIGKQIPSLETQQYG